MRIRFWVGMILIALAAGLFAYRGQIVGYVGEKWEKRGVPEAVTYEEVKDEARLEQFSATGPVPSPQPLRPRSEGGLNTSTPLPSLPPTPLNPPSGRGEKPRAREEIPAEFNLAVPFTSQAPFEDWNLPYKEACEEASVAMVDAFYKNRELTKRLSDEEIKKLVDWQVKNLGHYEDTTAEETARILREKYGYGHVRVVENPTIDDIKREVAQGRPVILPAAGRLLGNRYFRQPGPLYHMLVVRGWTKNGKIITNDPGTKRGEGYLYDPDVLMNAVHDWNGGDVVNGRKVMIVVEK